jgi:hypothetical protein
MSRRNQRKAKAKTSGFPFQRILAVVGTIVLMALLVLGLEMLYAFHLAHELLPSATFYAEGSGRAIMTAGSEEQLENVLMDRLSSKAKAATTKGQLAQMYQVLTSLGNFEYYNGVYGKQEYAGYVDLLKGPTVRYTFTANAAFEKGIGIITMVVTRRDNDWQISTCNITTTGSRF